MEQFLENVNNYIKTNGLNLEASLENKNIQKNLILQSRSGEIKSFKIEELKILPIANRRVSNSNIHFMKINPYSQTDQWLNEKLKHSLVVKNRIKLK